MNLNLDWIQEITNDELKEISIKANDFKLLPALNKYLEDMINIVKTLKTLNDDDIINKEGISASHIVNKLIGKDITLGMSRNSLVKFIPTLIDFLKENLIFFELEYKTRQSHLYINQKLQLKECGRCHEIKEFSEFYMGKYRLHSYCKECENLMRRLNEAKFKIEVINNIDDRKYNGKCPECGTSILKLPALEMHHSIKELKTINFSRMYKLGVKNAITRLEMEEAVLLCSNCHSKRQAIIFNEYLDLILKDNLFYYSAEDIENLVVNAVDNNLKIKDITNWRRKYEIKTKMMEWIKKRAVIEQLYDSKCVGCGKISVKNNLSSLDFHHTIKGIEKFIR